jgi:hypothetical protein
MFKANTGHTQDDLFSSIYQLSPEKQKKLRASKYWCFYELIFCQIDESLFAILYSDKGSRPNAPINTMVASLVIKHQFGWTFEELFEHIDFDVLTRTALGLRTFETTPFVPSTLFDFQRRLFAHQLLTGENLFEKVFDRLTNAQLEDLKLKTSIQRTDSVMLASNIRDYSRLQLLIEIVLRLHRVLSETDQAAVKEWLAPYLRQSSSTYLYRLERAAIPDELNKLGHLYHTLYRKFQESYGDTEIFAIFERVYTEHFRVSDETMTVIAGHELSGKILQSPDDPDATYRKKRGGSSKGFVLNAVETAHPDNPVNLLVDVTVEPNTTDDSVVLNGRLEALTRKTPDLTELHTDGGYTSDDNDKALTAAGIVQIQTAVRGHTRNVEFTMTPTDDKRYQVSCPLQTATSQSARMRLKACFHLEICAACAHASVCPAQQQKTCRTFYFTPDDAARQARYTRIATLPVERRSIRSNVEATIREFVNRLDRHTVSVRGLFKTALFALSRAMAINFGRIFRYQGLTAREACV